jgi:hypothetical protein
MSVGKWEVLTTRHEIQLRYPIESLVSQMRLVFPLSLLFGSIFSVLHAFVVTPHFHSHHSRVIQVLTMMTIKDGGEEEQPPPIECYLVTDQAVVAEGDPPKIVCTSDPEEYAWFNGIDPKKLHKTDIVSELSTECVEGASPRGIPEWECQ